MTFWKHALVGCMVLDSCCCHALLDETENKARVVEKIVKWWNKVGQARVAGVSSDANQVYFLPSGRLPC